MGPGTEQGFLLHSALALTTEGVPLGLVGQIAWARDPESRGKSAHRRQLPIEEKEIYRWLRIQEQIAAHVSPGTKTVLMGDRESDIYDLFIAPRTPQQELLVRAAWDRKLADPPGHHLMGGGRSGPRHRNDDDYGARPAGQPLTLRDAVRAMAKLGGVPGPKE